MAKKRVNELAREHDMPAKEVIERLRAAGIEVKAQASAVDEVQAKRALTGQPIEVPETTNGKTEPAQPKRTGPRVPPRNAQPRGGDAQRAPRQEGGGGPRNQRADSGPRQGGGRTEGAPPRDGARQGGGGTSGTGGAAGGAGRPNRGDL